MDTNTYYEQTARMLGWSVDELIDADNRLREFDQTLLGIIDERIMIHERKEDFELCLDLIKLKENYITETEHLR